MMKPIATVLLLTVVSIVLIIVGIFVLPWALLFLGIYFSPDPPRPEMTYGEFPFRLEYEIEGKRVAVEDTLICEFDGIGMNEGVGKYRKWTSRLASGKEEVIILEDGLADPSDSELGVVEKYLYIPVGSPNYYMGDPKEYVEYKEFPDAILYTRFENGSSSHSVIFPDELLEKYKIRLISFEHAEPIQNRFIEEG